MALLHDDAGKAVADLKTAEEGLRDRRNTMDRQEYFDGRDSLLAAAQQIKAVVLAQYDEDADANWNMGVLLSRLGRDSEALQVLERAREARPDDVYIPHKIAHSYMKLYKHRPDPEFLEGAIAAAKDAIAVEPDAKSYELYGETLFTAKRYEDAAKAFGTAIDKAKDQDVKQDGYLERRMSELLRRYLDDPHEALDYALDAYEADPSNRRNVEELGYAYTDTGDYYQAIPLLMYAHAQNPELRITLLKLHDCLASTEQYDLAMEYAERIETHAHNRPLSLAKKLRIAEESPKHAYLAPQLAATMEQECPDSYDTAKALAGYFFANEEYERALPYLKRVSNDRGGHMYLNRTAQAMRETDDLAGSEAIIRKALQTAPKSPHTLLAAGWHFHDTNQMDQARLCAEELDTRHPDFRAASALKAVTAEGYNGVDWIRAHDA